MYSFQFDTSSYFTGVLTGMVIRWTDIVPIFGGFLLGISFKRLPEFVDLSALPISLQNILGILGNPDKNQEDIPKLKIPLVKKNKL